MTGFNHRWIFDTAFTFVEWLVVIADPSKSVRGLPFQYLLALLPCGTRNCIVTKPISGTQQFFPLRSRRPD